MGILYYMVITIFNLSYVITIVSSVEICRNCTETGGQLILNKIYGSGGSCGCLIKLANGDRNSNVIINSTDRSGGCQYKLMFRLKNKTREYSCRDLGAVRYQFLMTPTDHLYVNLMNDQNNTSGFVFNFNIHSDTRVNLSCRSPWTNPNLLVTTQSTTTVGENSFHSESNPGLDGPTGPTEIQVRYSETTEIQDKYSGTTEIQVKYSGTTERNKIPEETETSALIVGLSVGGVVLVSVVILTGIICFLKRRKQKLPEQSVTNQNITDINQHQNTHDIILNNIYSSLHSPEHDLNDSERYEQLWKDHKHVPEQQDHVPEQQENVPEQVHVPEQHEHIPNTSSEYVNNIIPQHVYSSLDNDLKDSERYEQFPKQQEQFPKQQEQVPQTKNEYVNVQKKSLKCQNHGTELNNNPNTVQENGCYENLIKDI